MIDRVPEEPGTEARDMVQKAVIKTIPKKTRCKKTKWLSEEVLQITEKSEAKGKGEKERYIYLNAEFQRIPRRDKKAFLSDQCKEIEENNRIERPEISSTKLKTPREHFIEKTGTIKDRNTKDLTTVEEIKKGWRENTEKLYKKRS